MERVSGDTLYDDPAGARQVSRQRVNAWIRAPGHLDAVVDFDRAVRAGLFHRAR
ncbi:hypothetical protein ACWC2T_41735 [Streptomyces sp. NPDC001393]